MLRQSARHIIRSRVRHFGVIAEAFRENQSIDYKNPTGLFGNPLLTSANNFRDFTNQSLAKASSLSNDIIAQKVPIKESILRLDVLSDVICKVVDMAGFVRLSHPDEEMLQVTTEAHQVMFEFMNQLNTSRDLYLIVCEALKQSNALKLSTEEVRVGEILKHDFQKTGIQFDTRDPDANIFVQCSNVVSVCGQVFLDNIGPKHDTITLSLRDLYGLDPGLINEFTSFTGQVRLPLASLGELALQVVHSSASREKIWRALKSADNKQIELLEQVLTHRHGLASASGYKSFAHYELADKLMKTPENVASFLQSLQQTVWPKAHAEMKSITPPGVQMNPWDHMYYVNRLNSAKRGLAQEASSIMSYFSLGNVLQGISDLCERLYGIRFEPGTVRAGEVWSPEVRRLDVYEGPQKIGTIYCDLFQREGKSPNPAHFTIQCSRQVWPWETELYNSESLSIIEGPDGIEKHQLPVIALVCDFWVRNGRCFLTFNEVQTLFHEMGHAIHSMIGRTNLHNVAGTRCATDFVELPSILMEKFASEPKVLQTFAKHYETDEPLPIELFKKMQTLNNNTEQWESYHQILLSMIDQKLHSSIAGSRDFNASNTVRELTREYSMFPEVFSQQYAQFGHLISYGSTYYSYLLDRCLANIFWEKLFNADPLSEKGGETFKNKILKYGGSRDPLDCIRNVIDRDVSYEEIAKHI